MKECVREKRWIWPAKGDPRWPFAGLLLFYCVLGTTVLGFNRNPLQIGLTIGACCVLEMSFARWFRGEKLVPLSAFITGLGLSLLVNYPHDYFLLFLPAFFAIGSKYVLTFEGRHLFNPNLCGVMAALVLGSNQFASSPAYQWGETSAVLVFIVMAAIVLFVFRIRRTALILAFLLFFSAQTILRAWLMRWHLPWETILRGTAASPAFFLFTFYMITDPKTSPEGAPAQIGWALLVTLLDLYFHLRFSLATIFFALFTASALRWVWLHGRRLLASSWPGGLRILYSRQWLDRAAGVSAVGCAGAFLYSGFIHPKLLAPHPGFRFEKINASGLHAELGTTLKEIDPRVQHIAKWLLSVGDAVAIGDFDGDGLPDLFLTNPLKRPEDRNALYKNLGGFRFERVPLPVLDEVSAHPQSAGLVAGALFVDYDNSGRQSLFLTTGWGKVILLKNSPGADGKPVFSDVTREAGIDEYTVSVAATFADFDLDGRLDLFIGNSLAPELPDYSKPTRFNLFKLPQPEYEGDRRMFHFMHHGWHNAENGGRNVLYSNLGGGRFGRQDAAALGMPETHWTLAVGTADLNHDGWPDLYCANDFGPDDLYLNRAGRGFERVLGTFNGSIGKDTYKGMNVSIGDLDNRGWQDIYVSNVHAPLQAEGSLLWRTEPNSSDPFHPKFHDAASTRRLLNENRFGWGAVMGDLNLDGWLDLVQANGMVDDTPDKIFAEPRSYWYKASLVMRAGPEVHGYADRWADLRGYEVWGRQANRVYLSKAMAPALFVDVASDVGLTALTNTRAAALADFDNDGRLDLVLTHQFADAEIFRNTSQNATNVNWIGFQLAGDGVRVNRDAVGTQVFVSSNQPGAPRQMREVSMTSGFSAQSDRRLLFGLGEHAGPVEVEIHWPGGGRQILRNVRIGSYHLIRFESAPKEAN